MKIANRKPHISQLLILHKFFKSMYFSSFEYRMRVAISGDDGFVAQHLAASFGDDVVLIDTDTVEDSRLLDAALASVGCLIHLNGHPPNSNLSRDSPEAIPAMKQWAVRLADAKNRHQGLHMILLGSLRVHSDETFDAYTGETSLSPRDATAVGQLWTEERCLEHAMDTHPVSILRVSNLHGTPVDGGRGRGFLFDFARQAQSGWIAVPGDGEGIKDLIHIRDLVNIISGIAKSPPPTREALAIGLGNTTPLKELALPIAEAHSAEIQLWAASGDEQWGFVEANILHHRLAWTPEVEIDEIIAEALGNVAENLC